MGALRRRIPYPARLMAYAALLAGAATVLAVLRAGPPATAAPQVAPQVAAVVTGHPASLRMGSISLRRCAAKPLTYCGGLDVPLDYSSAASPRIHLGFRWLPATSHPAGTILAVEGGPGTPPPVRNRSTWP